MKYLLDTNVVSELVRPRPSAAVLDWFTGIPDDTLHVSVLTFGEIRKGLDLLTASPRREQLRAWLEHELPAWFGDRLLPVDTAIADRWGLLLAMHPGKPSAVDSLLAATALANNLTLVTRNTKDFDYPGLEVVDPWAFTAT